MMSNVNLTKAFNSESIAAINKLSNAGYKAYFVGGAIRDTLLGIPINDVDVITSATPQEVIKVFSGYPIIPTGIEHGTVIVVYEGEMIDVTTFRDEGVYSDNRRPDNVVFTTSLSRDLNRRDFTINSLVYNPTEGLVDLVNGKEDLANKTIRTVGVPGMRFKEDALRIMRALRFSSKLGFEIEANTKKAIFENKDLLNNISPERLQMELNELVMGKHAKKVMLEYSEIISVFIPEIKQMIGFEQNNPHHLYNVYEHSLIVMENTKNELTHKLAGLFHDIGKPNTMLIKKNGFSSYLGHAYESEMITRKILNRLHYSNKIKDKTLALIRDHSLQLSSKKYKVAKIIYEEGIEHFFDLIEFQKADDLGKDLSVSNREKHHERLKEIANEYLENSPILSHKDLAITPHDLIAMGLKGKEIGDELHHLVLVTLSGHLNDREKQIEYVKRRLKEISK